MRHVYGYTHLDKYAIDILLAIFIKIESIEGNVIIQSLTIFRRKFIDFLIIAIRIKSIKCIDRYRCNIIENKYKSVTLNICM